MNIGIISDIHANLPALRAVLAELDARSVDLIVCAGDLVCYSAQPNEVLDLVRARGIQSVVGNYDDAVAWRRSSASRTTSSAATEPLKRAALAWTIDRLDAAHGPYLRGLPWRADLRVDGLRMSLVHAGLEHLDEWVTPHHPGLIEDMVQRLAADVLVLGHTHTAYSVVREQTLVINPGAVGRSLDGDPRAAFAILDTTTRRVELRRVTYDVASAIAAIETSGMPPAISSLIRYAVRRIEEVPNV